MCVCVCRGGVRCITGAEAHAQTDGVTEEASLVERMPPLTSSWFSILSSLAAVATSSSTTSLCSCSLKGWEWMCRCVGPARSCVYRCTHTPLRPLFHVNAPVAHHVLKGELGGGGVHAGAAPLDAAAAAAVPGQLLPVPVWLKGWGGLACVDAVKRCIHGSMHSPPAYRRGVQVVDEGQDGGHGVQLLLRPLVHAPGLNRLFGGSCCEMCRGSGENGRVCSIYTVHM